jgi:hypothetical protein
LFTPCISQATVIDFANSDININFKIAFFWLFLFGPFSDKFSLFLSDHERIIVRVRTLKRREKKDEEKQE